MMKKVPQKLVLHREVVRHLQTLDKQALGFVRGGENTSPALKTESTRGCDIVDILTTVNRG